MYNAYNSGLSRSTSFATESLLGQDETEAGRSEKLRQSKGSSEMGMTRYEQGKVRNITTFVSCNRSDFVSTVCNILGDALWSDSAERMFTRCSRESNIVTWSDVLNFYIDIDQEKSKATVFQPLHHDGDFKAAQHSRYIQSHSPKNIIVTLTFRRETIVKIISVSTGTSYVYIITSKFGHVGIYDDKLRLQRRYEIDIDTDPDSDLDVAASDPGWITDAVWMDNSKHMVYTSSLR